MYIIVVGCGKIGSRMVAQLSKEDHNITVVDTNYAAVEQVVSEYDVIGINGSGASSETMKEAGIENADILLAMTGNDELNLLSCLLASTLGDCRTIARIENPMYEKEVGGLKEKLGLAMTVNADRMAAEEITRLVSFPSALHIDTFNRGKVELIKVRIREGSALGGIAIKDISTKYRYNVLICAVERGHDEVVIPNGDFVLQEGDLISLISTSQTAANIYQMIGAAKKRTKSCMIVGGGSLGFYVAKELLAMGIHVTIIEKNPEKSQWLNETLLDANVICENAIKDTVMEEEGIANMDAFVASTDMDESNVLLTLYAQNNSNAKAITKLSHMNPANWFGKNLKLDSVISPKDIAADIVTQFVRAMDNSRGSNVETLYHLVDNKVEALEFHISENCPITDKPLKDLKLKKNLVIACISRRGKIIIPNGQSMIRQGDNVIVVTTIEGLSDIRDIFK